MIARVAKTLSYAALALAFCGGAAQAVPMKFKFSGLVTYGLGGPSSMINGVLPGDTFVFELYAENGGSSLLNQTWIYSDITAMTLQAGSYSASSNTVPGWGLGSIQTDGVGAVVKLDLYVNQYGLDSNGDMPIGYEFGRLANFWSIDAVGGFGVTDTSFAMSLATPVTPVPVPAALPLLASVLGLMGLFGLRRQKAA